MKLVDLHVHTTESDGTFTPEQAVAYAAKKGLAAIAVCDHDSALGHTEALAAGEKYGVEVIPGIEISTKFKSAVHILGYYIDAQEPNMKAAFDWMVADRDGRNEKICEIMRRDGIKADYAEMKERFGTVVGRPHFARILVEQGYAVSIADAFNRYVNRGCKYYLPRSFLSLEDSVKLIVGAGGTAVLAHPFQYKLDDAGLRELIEVCISYGLSGMECRYTGYSEERSAYLEALAEEYGLVKTGGSDFHGANKPLIDMGSGSGGLCVPYEFLEGLKKANAEQRHMA